MITARRGGNRLGWTMCNTLSAHDATLSMVHALEAGLLTFRVVTPGTGQRAALEKNRGADSWTVMNSVPLDIEYHTV